LSAIVEQPKTQVDDEIIHKIYGCATGECDWEDALRPIIGLLEGKCLGIVKHSIAPIKAEVLVRIDVDTQTETRYVEEYVHINPFMNCVSAMPLGFVTSGPGVLDETHFRSSTYYNDWQKPAGYADNLCMALARRQGEFVLLTMPRDFKRGAYTREDLMVIKPYVAHLVRSFNIWLRLQAAETGAEWVSEALDQVGKGLIILGEDRVVLYANKSGEQTLLAGQLARENFRLVCKVRESVQQMNDILHEFETGQDEETKEYGFAIPRGIGRPPLFVRVQPPLGLKPGQRSLGLPKAVAFLHIIDPEQRDKINTSLFAQGYGLTAAEARLLDAAIQTESVVEAAAMLDIGEATARTHIRHILAKTDTASFASLIGRVYRSTLNT
jgi:DNA-binding CsgD family transcriptional regulator